MQMSAEDTGALIYCRISTNTTRATCMQMSAEDTGALIYKLDPMSVASKVLQRGDIVTQVGGVPVAGDTTVPFRSDERLDLSHSVRERQIGEEVELCILRDGQPLTVTYALSQSRGMVPSIHGVECLPSYFIFGAHRSPAR